MVIGINMVPLATFAMDAYRDDPCRQFILKDSTDEERSKKRNADEPENA